MNFLSVSFQLFLALVRFALRVTLVTHHCCQDCLVRLLSVLLIADQSHFLMTASTNGSLSPPKFRLSCTIAVTQSPTELI